jgi:hypothetical protein
MTTMQSPRRASALAALLALALIIATHTPQATAADAVFQPWVKRGVVLEPGFAGSRSTLRMSAPSVVKLKDGRLRMYFWTMGHPTANVAPGTEPFHYIFAAEASPSNPFVWKLVKQEPMLGPAPSGNIRDRGPSFPWVVPRDDAPWLMYYGAWGTWAPPKDLSNRTGLAISRDQGITWEVLKETVLPLGKPGSYDAGLTGSVDVMRTGHDSYMMWYTAGERYQMVGDVYRGIVHIGMARSKDGIEWTKFPEPAMRARLDAVKEFEAVVSKPSVVLINGVYHMWFSVFDMQSKGYRLGYARSPDGVKWTRYYEQILPLTPGDFDSSNQSYPYVVDMGQQLWMFYTGNSFGSTGIGLATLDKDKLRP